MKKNWPLAALLVAWFVLTGAVSGIPLLLRTNAIRLASGTTFTLYDSAGNAGPVCTDAGTTFNCVFDGDLTGGGLLIDDSDSVIGESAIVAPAAASIGMRPGAGAGEYAVITNSDYTAYHAVYNDGHVETIGGPSANATFQVEADGDILIRPDAASDDIYVGAPSGTDFIYIRATSGITFLNDAGSAEVFKVQWTGNAGTISNNGGSVITGTLDTATINGTNPMIAVSAEDTLYQTPSPLTIADSGGAGVKTHTALPSGGAVDATCNDADGCEWTITESGATAGECHRITNVGTNSLVMKHAAGQVVFPGSADQTLGQNDSADLCYSSTRSAWLGETAINR